MKPKPLQPVRALRRRAMTTNIVENVGKVPDLEGVVGFGYGG